MLPEITVLGQVFTPPAIVREMVALRRNRGAVLEPSCGDGAFMAALGKGVTGIDIDATLPRRAGHKYLRQDFFAYPVTRKYPTIIGNPPYVRYQDILPETKVRLSMRLFDKRSNLYLFFIEKCTEHLTEGGELIFITPRDFLKATSAARLNQLLFTSGSFTYYRELGDAAVFKGYSPNCAIWRWQKGLRRRRTRQGQYFNYHNGQIWFSHTANAGASAPTLATLFDVKVGAVSGADRIFASARHGNVDMVCSRTATDGSMRRVIYNMPHQSLRRHKAVLLARKIRSFSESNWWEWGRRYYESTLPRIYVNCKTRRRRPFFIHRAAAYDGSVLALLPKSDSIDIGMAAEKLNSVAWDKLGFVVDGRLLFTQRSLANIPLELSCSSGW